MPAARTSPAFICATYLFHETVIPAWEDVCTSILCLSALQSLEFADINLSEVSEGAWKLSTRLTSLVLDHCELEAIPPAPSQIPLSGYLKVADRALIAVLSGAYLCNLQSLTLAAPRAGVGPEVLTAARHLEKLLIHIPKGFTSVQEANPLWVESQLRRFVPPECEIDDNYCY